MSYVGRRTVPGNDLCRLSAWIVPAWIVPATQLGFQTSGVVNLRRIAPARFSSALRVIARKTKAIYHLDTEAFQFLGL